MLLAVRRKHYVNVNGQAVRFNSGVVYLKIDSSVAAAWHETGKDELEYLTKSIPKDRTKKSKKSPSSQEKQSDTS